MRAPWILAVVLAAALPGAEAGDLDPAQAKTLATLATYVKQVETNVALAADAAGPGTATPTAAQGRLARTRLAQPKGLLPQVRAELDKLPAANADVAALRARLDAAEEAVRALEARLDGKAGPGAAPPAPPATGTRLDYKQQKELADAEAYAREVEGLAAALRALAQELEAAPDKDAFDHRRLGDGAATIARARQRGGLVTKRLVLLPPDGTGVKAVADALAAALASVAASEATLEPVRARLEALLDPAQHPELAADVKRLQGLAQMLADPVNLFAGRPRRAAEVVRVADAAVEEHRRVTAAYRLLVVQRTAQGEAVAAASRFFTGNHAEFLAAAEAARASLGASIDAALAAVVGLADQAVKEEKPAFFTGGIPQRVAALEELVALGAALDPATAAGGQRRLDELRATLTERAANLREAIIQANPPPADAYQGADRAALEQAAVAAWKKLQPGAEVLGVRLPSERWSRETLWRKQNASWYLIDRSHLQALVLVRHDAALAALRAVDLWIDHADGDRRSAVPLDGADEAPPPHALLPLAKVR